MKITDYLAIWGAVIATGVASWNIYKDVIKRERVRLSMDILAPSGHVSNENYLLFQVTNLTTHKIRVTDCGSYPGIVFKDPRFLKKETIPRTYQHALFKAEWSESLPADIEPWRCVCFAVEVNIDTLPEIRRFYVKTGDQKEWCCRRKEALRVLRSEYYLASQKRRRARR
jgi:hypothetical protein